MFGSFVTAERRRSDQSGMEIVTTTRMKQKSSSVNFHKELIMLQHL